MELFLAILLASLACVLLFALTSHYLVKREFRRAFQEDVGEPPPLPPGTGEGMEGPPPEHRLRTIDLSYLVTGVIGAFLALLLSYYLSRRISRPIGKLADAARLVAEGDLGHQVEVSGFREVEELAAVLNSLSRNLAANESLRKNLVADISHELRTPLAAQRGYLEALEDGVIEFDREALQVLARNNLLLTRLVDDLRQLALADSGQLELFPREVDLDEALRNTAAGFEGELQEKGVTIEFRLPRCLPGVKADPERLYQILGNLLHNAITYTPEGGTVTLGAEAEGDEVIVFVADTEPGVAPEELQRIFERFYRTDRSRARDWGGTGLGLSIAKSLVEAQGGRIRAESEPGKGLRILFSLPAASSPE